jgi:ABC-type polysaccharide/polyol phosphate export permease
MRNRHIPFYQNSFFQDILEGAKRKELWMLLGWNDLKRKYRRTKFGHVWIPLGLMITITVMGPLYGGLLNKDLEIYVPYLAFGFCVWNLIQSFITAGATVFIRSSSEITDVKAPYSIHVFRMIWSSIITFFYSLIGCALIAIFFNYKISLNVLYFIPGFLLILLNGFWFCMIFGVICTRFRDMQQVINSLMRLIFFATPIMWYPEMAGTRSFYVKFNPFYFLLDITRSPLLGDPPKTISWVVVSGIAIIGWFLAHRIYSRFANNIPFWI